MSIKRVTLALAMLLLPSILLAQAPPPGPTRTTFTVNKTFSDGNSDASVTVHIQCFTGVPLNQSQTRDPDGSGEFEVEFVVENYDDGELDCDVWEEEVPGYSAEYTADSLVTTEFSADAEGCHFEDIATAGDPPAGEVEFDSNLCEIVNTPDPVEVVVTKQWVIDGEGGDELDTSYRLRLYCEDEIVDGYEQYSGNWRKTLFDGSDSDGGDYSADVIPNWDGGTDCWVEETVYDSSVEVHNGCENIFVEIGEGDSCTVVNTVFYEGIPTLSQYGLAIMALLMLGVGFVGFRRFV